MGLTIYTVTDENRKQIKELIKRAQPGWVDRKELEEALIKARELSPKEVFMGKTIKLNGRDDNYETCRRIFKVAYDYISDNRISDVEACLGCDGVFFRRNDFGWTVSVGLRP